MTQHIATAPSTSPKKLKTYVQAFDKKPEYGGVIEILPGFHWLRLHLPFELNHINIWFLESNTGWSIIDSGFNDPEATNIWNDIFTKHLRNKPVENIFITHFHPDHFGLAGFLSEKTGQGIQMTAGEYTLARTLSDPGSEEKLRILYKPYYDEAGVGGDLLAKLLDKRTLYKKIVYAPPQDYTEISLGDTVTLGGKPWRVIGGGGHSPEHAGLYNAEDKIFIAGDMVLPDITPNISFFPGNGQDHDPIADYHATLARIRAEVPDDVIAFPSHGVPFRGLHKRIAEIEQHHAERTLKIREIAAEPKTALEIMQALFAHRDLTHNDLFFALSETLAHLVHDVKVGGMTKTLRDGVAYYMKA